MFKDKVVWITGASSGIGEELAKQFSNLGATVVLSARNVDKLQKVQSQLERPEKSMIIPLDLEDSTNFVSLAKEVVEKNKKIDILVNNGGLSQRGEVADTPIEVDRRIWKSIILGMLRLQKLYYLI